MTGLNEYLEKAPAIWKPYEPTAWTTAPTTGMHMVCTTSAEMPIMVESPMQDAMEYVREREPQKEFMFHICRCDYCFSNYVANLELGYECPGCGAYSFEIERSVDK